MRRVRPYHAALLAVLLLASAGSAQQNAETAAFRLAQGYEQAGDFERAVALYRELLAREPGNVVYADGLYRSYLQTKRYEEAIALLQSRLAIAPADIGLRSTLAATYYRAGREADARAAWDAVIDAGPTSAVTYRVVAGTLIENRLLDRAAEVYRRGRVACGDSHLFTLELAQLLAVSMDFSGATAEYVRWLQQNPTQLSFVQSRMAVYTGKPEARAAALEVVRNAAGGTPPLPIAELLAWLHVEGRDFRRALDVYRDIDRRTNASGAALQGFADRAFKERAFDVAVDAYREAIAVPLPASRQPAAMYGVAAALRELSVAADTAGPARPAPGDPVREVPPRTAGAIAAFQTVAERFPGTEWSARAYYQTGTLQFHVLFDLDAALRSFETAGREVGGVPTLRYDVALRCGEVHSARGDTARAAASFTLVAGAPDALPGQADEALFRLAELDFFAGRMQSALQRLDGVTVNLKADYANDALQLQALLQGHPGVSADALASFARSALLERQRKYSEAGAMLQAIVEGAPSGPLADDAMLQIALLQERAGRYAAAAEAYERLLTAFRDNSPLLDRARFLLAGVLEHGLHDGGRAVAAYERLLADYPSSIYADTARRRIRALRGDLP